MRKLTTLILAATLTALSGIALACEAPDSAPEIPDPSAVETAQMVKANAQVKAYVAKMEEYLGCSRMLRGDKQQRYRDLEAYAEEFNAAIRAFRARQS